MEEIIEFIKKIGFIDNENIFTKKYKEHNNYEIKIDIKKGEIYFRDDEKTTLERKKDGKIQMGDTTSSHFKNNQEVNSQETFVVLECVNRLLEKGYVPEDIHIERRWKVGHGASGGKADVNVYGKNEETLFIVECKTSGIEYEKEKNKMLNDGGQLFTYLAQDRSAEYLVLYSSSFEENEIIYENIIVKIIDDNKKIKEMEQKGIKEGYTYREAKGKEKQNLFSVWKNIYNSYYFRYGIFEVDVNAYSIELKPLKKKDLIKLKSSKGLFNKYSEILRHNNISESDRAFNKILSLLLCKIVDEEEKNENEVLDFQVIEGEENEKLIDKLQRLFKEGMQRYLGIHDFVYYSDEDVESNIKLFPKRTPLEKVMEIFKEIKYYTNNEFAFKDVYNKKLFTQNTEILKEVIEIFQHYKFKNEHKDQFLGDFFELLLNHGVKQSEGQFFTPLPIVRFIILSLDFEEMINKKMCKYPHSPLLKTLDYSCGAGHFLIEAISEIDRINIEKNITDKNINDWTKKYIFGIEKDDRLARTSKIACFLNGDGEANIIYGDGLKKHKELEEEKEKFDLLITNPPYSVKAFKNYIDIDFNDYELFNELSDKSSQIEALFVERAKQVLKVEGRTAIILPSSILSNTGIYTKVREIILKYFNLIAVTELGSQTFIATGTNTVVLFMERKDDKYAIDYKRISEKIFNSYKFYDNDYLSSEEIFYKFIEYRNLPKENYINFIKNEIIDEIILDTEVFNTYKSWFENLTEIKNMKNKKTYSNLSEEEQIEKINMLFCSKIKEIEKEKFYYFCLAFGQKTILIKSPNDNKKQKEFLGYEFNGSRGFEGINIYSETKLYNETDNSLKMNYYIKSAFRKNKIGINEEVKEYVKEVKLIDMLDFEKVDFEKQLNTNANNKLFIESKWNLIKLGDICDVKIGGTPSRSENIYWQDGNNLWVSISEMDGNIIYDTKEKITDLGIKKSNVKLIKKGTVLLSFKLSIGKVAIAGNELYTNEAIAALEIKDTNLIYDKKLFNKFLFIVFKNKYIDLEKSSNNAFGKSLNSSYLKDNVKIPLPPKEIQEKIVKEIEMIEEKEENQKKLIKENYIKIDNFLNNISAKEVTLKSVTSKIGSGATPRGGESSYKKSGISLIRSQNVYDYGILEDGLAYIDEEQADKLKNVIVEEEDILFNITGASVARCCIVEKKYLPARVNQHVCIIRAIEKVIPKYLQQILICTTIKSKLLDIAKGSTSREAITKQQLEEFKIPLPSIEEQKEIVLKIENIEKEIKNAKNELKKLEELKKKVLEENL